MRDLFRIPAQTFCKIDNGNNAVFGGIDQKAQVSEVDTKNGHPRLADEARQARDAADRHNDEIDIMVSGLNAAQRQEIDTLIERQGKERADLLREQTGDLKRRRLFQREQPVGAVGAGKDHRPRAIAARAR